MESFRKEQLGKINAVFESMYDYAKVLYRLYNELAHLQEHTKEYDDCLANIKIVVDCEKRLYKNQIDGVIFRLLEYLSNNENFYNKEKDSDNKKTSKNEKDFLQNFLQDNMYLIYESNEHSIEYYCLRRLFNHLKFEYFNRDTLSFDSIDSSKISSLGQKQMIHVRDNGKKYNIFDRKNEYEKILMIADYKSSFNYYNSLSIAGKKDESFKIYQNLLLFINPYLENHILFGIEPVVINQKNNEMIDQLLIIKFNYKTFNEIFENLNIYDDKVIKNENKLMIMKLLIILIHSVSNNFSEKELIEKIHELAKNNLFGVLNDQPEKSELMKEINKYLVKKKQKS